MFDFTNFEDNDADCNTRISQNCNSAICQFELLEECKTEDVSDIGSLESSLVASKVGTLVNPDGISCAENLGGVLSGKATFEF